MNIKTKNLCTTALGIALFVALSMCLRVPVFENYYLCLGYIAMAVYLYCFKTASGTIVGVAGTIVYCLLTNGLRGMPGWVLGNFVIGAILGTWFEFGKQFAMLKHRDFWGSILFNISTIAVIVAATAFGILVAKSATEVVLYAQPFAARIASNVPAFVADVVVLLASLPVCKIVYKHTKTKER